MTPRAACFVAGNWSKNWAEIYISELKIRKLRGEAMQSIPVGAAGSFSLVVMPDHLASRFKDVTLPPVLATPVMIMVMENAALNAIKPYLDAGESALGTHVDVRHLAATPVGRRVTGEAKVTNVDGRRIEFSIRATDGNEEIGAGTHERVVLQLSKLSERMKAKSAGDATE
jgi:fluoroacetyl-CoA thioesterase